MSGPLVSVIVPVYNVGPYLKECVASIRAQTYANLQIILVNDGSTDGSGQMCDVLAKEDARIQVFHQKNRGVSAARNAGLDAAKGAYVYFVDGDDWVETTMVEETVSRMEAGGYDLCSWGTHIVEEGEETRYLGRWKEKLFQFPTEKKRRRFLCRWILPCRLSWSSWGRSFRRDIIKDLRFDTGCALFEDLDFLIRYTAQCRNHYYLPKALYAYRQHSASAMHTNDMGKRARSMLHMLRRKERDLSDKPLFCPFYIYTGTGLCVFLWNYMEQETKVGLEQFAGSLKKSEDWDYLVGQAELAVRDRARIRRACGCRLGGQVNGLFQYLLSGDPSDYCRAGWLQTCFETLRSWKNRYLHGMRK